MHNWLKFSANILIMSEMAKCFVVKMHLTVKCFAAKMHLTTKCFGVKV